MRGLYLAFFIFISSQLSASNIADELLGTAKQHLDNKDWALAQSICEEAYQKSLNKNYTAGIITATLYSGWIHQNTGDIAMAVRKYLEVQSLTEFLEDSAALQNRAYASVNLGTILRKHEIFDLAVDNFYIGFDAAEKIGNKEQALGILINIQRAYRNAKNYTSSIAINQEVLSEAPRFSERNMMALNGIGIAHQLQGNYDLAKYYYQKLLQESISSGHSNYEAFAVHNLGDILYDQEYYTQSIEYYLEAIKIREANSNASFTDKQTSHRDLSKAYSRLGLIDEALYHAKMAEQYLLKVENCLECEVKLYTVLRDLMKIQGDDMSRNDYSEKLANASDQFSQRQLEIRYESKQPELRQVVSEFYAELRSQQEAKASQTLLFSVIAGFVSLILILGAYHLYSRSRVRRTLSAELEKLNWD